MALYCFFCLFVSFVFVWKAEIWSYTQLAQHQPGTIADLGERLGLESPVVLGKNVGC